MIKLPVELICKIMEILNYDDYKNLYSCNKRIYSIHKIYYAIYMEHHYNLSITYINDIYNNVVCDKHLDFTKILWNRGTRDISVKYENNNNIIYRTLPGFLLKYIYIKPTKLHIINNFYITPIYIRTYTLYDLVNKLYYMNCIFNDNKSEMKIFYEDDNGIHRIDIGISSFIEIPIYNKTQKTIRNIINYLL